MWKLDYLIMATREVPVLASDHMNHFSIKPKRSTNKSPEKGIYKRKEKSKKENHPSWQSWVLGSPERPGGDTRLPGHDALTRHGK